MHGHQSGAGRTGGCFQAEMTRMELYCLFSCNVITTFYRTKFPIAPSLSYVCCLTHWIESSKDIGRKLEMEMRWQDQDASQRRDQYQLRRLQESVLWNGDHHASRRNFSGLRDAHSSHHRMEEYSFQSYPAR